VRRIAIVLGLALGCDRDATPEPDPTPTPEPSSPAAAPEPAAAPIAVAPPPAPEPQPHGFAIVRPGARVHLRADDSLPTVTLADTAPGFTMAVAGREGDLIAFETVDGDTHCGERVGIAYGLRLRWLVAPADLVEVTTRRVVAEYDDGTKTELLAGVPLRKDGDGWIANAAGTEVWVRLPDDAIGRWYDAGDRAFAEGTRRPLRNGDEPLIYDRTREVAELRLESTYEDKRHVATFSREEKEGRTFAEVRTRCAAMRVVVPQSRAVDEVTEARAYAAMLTGSVEGSSAFGMLARGEQKPTWFVEPGTTGYWRDGTVGGLVQERRTFDVTPREVGGRMCFELAVTELASSRFDLCFELAAVQETVGASPGELDRPGAGLGIDLGAELGTELGTIGGGGLGSIGSGTGSTGVPRTRAGTVTVAGSLDKDIIRRIVRAHLGEVRSCYSKGLAKDPTLAGKVTIAFTIGPDGNVTTASVGDDTLSDATVGTCIAKRAKAWKFPKPIGGGVAAVRYPFSFSPS
jgi:hypothetical protein